MRRRPVGGVLPDQAEKNASKNQNSRLCCLASLSAFFWFLLLYFHFFVLADNHNNNYDLVQSNKLAPPLPINPESTPIHVSVANDAQTPPRKFGFPKSDRDQDHDHDHDTHTYTPPIDHGSHIQTNTPPPIQKKSFPFERALRTSDNKSDPCGGRCIYVHDLPSRFNEDMLKECKSLSVWTNMCKFTTNAGLGPPLENVEGVFSDKGWYATNQFAVDVIFSNRMKQYECLTQDSSIAAAIFVPFYAGFDIARYLWGYNISMRDAASLELVDWLMKRPEWSIMNGKDHFLVAGRITWDFRRLSEEESDWGNKLLFLPAANPGFVISHFTYIFFCCYQSI